MSYRAATSAGETSPVETAAVALQTQPLASMSSALGVTIEEAPAASEKQAEAPSTKGAAGGNDGGAGGQGIKRPGSVRLHTAKQKAKVPIKAPKVAT